MSPTHDQRKKILFVLEDFGSGGVQRVFVNLGKYLSNLGFDVIFAPLKNRGMLKDELVGIEVIPVKRYQGVLGGYLYSWRSRDEIDPSWGSRKRIRKVFKSAHGLSRLIEAIRPDIIYSGDMFGNCAVSEAARLIGDRRPKIVLSMRSHAMEILDADDAKEILAQGYLGLDETKISLVAGSWSRNYVKRCFSGADAFVVASKGLGLVVEGLVGRHDDIHVIPNPIVDERLRVLARERSCHPWIVSKTIPVIVSVGRYSPQKDFITLLEAFAEVRQCRNARLMIIGFNPKSKSQLRYKDRLVARARELGVLEDVCFEAATKNPYPLMAGSDIYVLSSPSEGFGNVLVEALYCQLPIVSTDCPSGPREILKNNEYGSLVPIGDPSAMAAQIAHILDIREQKYTKVVMERLRSRAEDFSEEKIMGKYEELISDLTH